ncbi:hypothetical protein HDU86_003527 [Geranomyces michiganensis]|nr:hypothetical protein HDU86_003527 [Geranomyces michiganensis]
MAANTRRSMNVSAFQFYDDDEPSAGCFGLRHHNNSHHHRRFQQRQRSNRTFEGWEESLERGNGYGAGGGIGEASLSSSPSRPGLLRRIATKLHLVQSAPDLGGENVYTPFSRERRRKSILKPLVVKKHSSLPNIHIGRRLSAMSWMSTRSAASEGGTQPPNKKKSVHFADEQKEEEEEEEEDEYGKNNNGGRRRRAETPVVKYEPRQPPAWVLEKFTSPTNQPWIVGSPAWRAAQRHASYPEEVLRTIPGNEEGDIFILTDPPLLTKGDDDDDENDDDNTNRNKEMPTARDGSFYVTHAPKTVIVTSDPLTQQHFGEAYVPGGEHLSLAAEAADAEAARWAKRVRRKNQMQQALLRAPFADDPLVRTWQREDKRLRQLADVPQPRRKLSLVPPPAPKLCKNRRGSSFAALMFGRPPPPLFAI